MSELYAGVDLGGTNVTCALADARGRMVATRKGPTRSAEGATAVLERIAAMPSLSVNSAEMVRRILAAGG